MAKNPVSAVKDIFTKFPKVFWTVQIFELCERGAYYLMMPILVWHAIINVGVPVGLAMVLTMFMYPLQYGIPIFSGALAEKIGYRKQMIFAFSVLSAAYLFLSFAASLKSVSSIIPVIWMIIGVMSVGFGIGSYKPLVSATVAKCTTDKDRNIAYSVYYWVVNLAAAVFPLIWTALSLAGFLNESMYEWVFRVGFVFMGVNVLVGIFVFREVPRSGQVKTVKDVINNVTTAFKDKKFVVMVVLIGGFWALYSSMLNALPIAILGFGFAPPWVTAMMIGILNPFTIISLGIPLAKLVEKMESLKALMSGVALYVVGLIIIGLSLRVWWLVAIGIIIASIGEFMVAPGYLAFVSKLAPKEKVSAYIGCNFLATMIGLFGGTIIFGSTFTLVGTVWERPSFAYGIYIAVGCALLIGFMLYYKAWGADIIERAKQIKIMQEGADALKDDKTTDFIFTKPFDFRISMLAPAIIIPTMLVITFMMPSSEFLGGDEGGTGIVTPDFDIQNYDVTQSAEDQVGSANVNEGDTVIEVINITPAEGQLVSSVTFTLTWQDEPDQRILLQQGENQPDEFEIRCTKDGVSQRAQGQNARDPNGGTGTITITLTFEHDSADSINGTGDYDVEITLIGAGDFTPRFAGPLMRNDVSNGYTLTYSTEIYTPKAAEE